MFAYVAENSRQIFIFPPPPQCSSVLVAFSLMFQYVITKTSMIHLIIKQVTVFATSHLGVM